VSVLSQALACRITADHGDMRATPLPILLDTADAATYCGVRPATLRVWRHRYGLTPWRSRSGANLYALEELAELLARRAGDNVAPAAG
jgi:hypothetical protein